MSRLVAVTVRSLTLSLGLAASAAAQEPPPLEPPSLEPPRTGTSPPAAAETSRKPASVKPAPPPAVRPAPARPESRPMLAIPGVTAPSSRPPAPLWPPVGGPITSGGSSPSTSLDALPLPSGFRPARSGSGSSGFPLAGPSPPSPDALPLPLDRPAAGMPSDRRVISRPGSTGANPPGESIPLTIEPLDEEPPRARGSTGRPATPRTTNGRPSGAGPSSRTRDDDEPIGAGPAPRRPPGILGRLFAPPAPLPPPRESSRVDERSRTKKDTEADADLDPDVVARRRIERQIRATLGDKVRSFDVSVTGRNVVISAQPSRFWLRRSVRRSLETLPGLQGYRARIDVSE